MFVSTLPLTNHIQCLTTQTQKTGKKIKNNNNNVDSSYFVFMRFFLSQNKSNQKQHFKGKALAKNVVHF